MVLLVREGCPHCDEEIKEMAGKVINVVQHPDGSLYMKLDEGVYNKLPYIVPGLPALIVDKAMYIGSQPIKNFLAGGLNGHTV